MLKRTIPAFDSERDTQNRILDAATRLFALKCFKAVTLNDIAKAVGIKTASIYYYYKDKDALIEDVLFRFEKTYREYHDWLSEVNENAESLDEVMENVFSREFLKRLNPIACLGMSLTLKEQHNNESACKCAFQLIYEDSIQNIQSGFDRLIREKIIPPSDTKTLATLFMFCVMSGNEIQMHEFADTKAPIDCMDIYGGLKKLMTVALRQGILQAGRSIPESGCAGGP